MNKCAEAAAKSSKESGNRKQIHLAGVVRKRNEKRSNGKDGLKPDYGEL